MNVVTLMGRLTKDPEYRAGETSYCRFTLAVDRKNEGTDFINCVSFARTAEFIDKYFRKGMKIALRGRIQTGSYTNRDGKRVNTSDVVAEEVEFCEKKSDAPRSETKQTESDPEFITVDELDDEGLPFN